MSHSRYQNPRHGIQHLFVYGSLQPGGPNAQVLSRLGGKWRSGAVTGQLIEAGWGAELGYPGLKLMESGGQVSGQVLSSSDLDGFWAELDAFEGEQYERVLAEVTLSTGELIDAHVYTVC